MQRSSVLRSPHMRRQPGGCCDSDHSPVGLRVPWLARRGWRPWGCGLSSANRDSSLGHQNPPERQSARPPFLFGAKQPPGGMSLTPLCPFWCVPMGCCKVSCPAIFSANSPVRKTARNLFHVPSLGGGQEDGGDLREKGFLLVGDTQPVFESARSLAATPAIVLPSAAFCKVAFPVVSSVTPVLSPGDLSHS